MTKEDMWQSLMSCNPEFRDLAEAHSRCESKLEEIIKSRLTNSEDLLEEITLKKQKLRLKDRMESIFVNYQRSTNSW